MHKIVYIRNFEELEIQSQSRPEDLTQSLRSYLIFGRILGILPFAGVRAGNVDKLKFRWKTFATISNCIVAVVMAVNVLIGIIGFFRSKSAGGHETVGNANHAIFYSIGLFTYLFFLLSAKGLLRALKEWKSMDFHFALEDKHFRRDAEIIAGLIFLSCSLENVTWHLKYFFSDMDSTDTGQQDSSAVLNTFYTNSVPQMSIVIPYHPLALAFLIMSNRFCLYAREFGDVFLIIISRALYIKFKILLHQANQKFLRGKGQDFWSHLLDDGTTLLNVLSIFDDVLSPLVFVSCSLNIYTICLQISVRLQDMENRTIVASIYSAWSFLHFVIKFCMISLAAAKINDYAMKIRCLLIKCPQKYYTTEIQRFEDRLTQSEIGLNGLGCFTMTMGLMLKMVGVIFTLEIVILQFYLSSGSGSEGIRPCVESGSNETSTTNNGMTLTII